MCLYRCNGGVTIADLADATRCPHPEIRAALGFLSRHGLVQTRLPAARLFAVRPQQRPAPPVSHPPQRPAPPRTRPPGCLPRLLARLKRARIHLSDRLWERLTWDVHRR